MGGSPSSLCLKSCLCCSNYERKDQVQRGVAGKSMRTNQEDILFKSRVTTGCRSRPRRMVAKLGSSVDAIEAPWNSHLPLRETDRSYARKNGGRRCISGERAERFAKIDLSDISTAEPCEASVLRLLRSNHLP